MPSTDRSLAVVGWLRRHVGCRAGLGQLRRPDVQPWQRTQSLLPALLLLLPPRVSGAATAQCTLRYTLVSFQSQRNFERLLDVGRQRLLRRGPLLLACQC